MQTKVARILVAKIIDQDWIKRPIAQGVDIKPTKEKQPQEKNMQAKPIISTNVPDLIALAQAL